MSTIDTPEAAREREGDWRLRLPFYYGWVIALASAVTLGLAYTVWYSFSVFYVALLEGFGWSRASSAGVFSVFVLFVGFAGAAAGALADRYGPGRVGSLGALLLAAGLVACSQLNELWQFYFFFGVVCAAGLAATGWIPSVTMVSRWFSAKYGAAIGTASAGIGVGILLMVPATQVVITAYGWRTAYLVLAAIVLLVVAPVEALVLKGRPEDIGLLRDGRRQSLETSRGSQPAASKPGANSGSPQPIAASTAPATPSRVVDRAWAERTWTVASALRTKRFWLIFMMLCMGNIPAQTIMVHGVAFLVDGGYDKLFAASAMGLVGLFSIFAKLGWGWASDRLGREVTWSLGFGALLVGIALLAATRLVPSGLIVYLYTLAFAFGYAVAPPLGPATAGDLFSGRRFGSIYGMLGIGNAFGSAGGALSAGMIFDSTGSYFLAFGVGVVASFFSVACMWLAAPRKVRLVQGKVMAQASVRALNAKS